MYHLPGLGCEQEEEQAKTGRFVLKMLFALTGFEKKNWLIPI